MRLEMARPSPVPPKRRVDEPSACSKSRKMRSWSCGVDADAGVAHAKAKRAVDSARLHHQRHAAVLGELDRVAGEIEQHLAQPRGIAADCRRQLLVDEGRDLDAFGLRARRQQLDRSSTSSRTEKLRVSSSSLPASILEKSSTSSISVSSVSPKSCAALT